MNIHITGGLGFIGSNLVKFLNKKGIRPIIYDIFEGDKWKNVVGADYELRTIRELFRADDDDICVHLFANSSTKALFNQDLWDSNVELTINICKYFGNKVIYASSAATYGAEEKDFTERIEGLKPTNAYGWSKLYTDKYLFNIIDKDLLPYKLYGLRFFNVYGFDEATKNDMASVPYRVFNKLEPLYSNTIKPDYFYKTWKLFKSERPEIKHGEQARDFIFVNDICKVIDWLIHNNPENGIYNVGSGRATTYNEIVTIVDPKPLIEYVDMPQSLKQHYQYYTCSNNNKLINAGYKDKFFSIKEAYDQFQKENCH